MDWHFIVPACKFRNRTCSSNEGESGNTGHRKCFQVIAPKKDNGVGFSFIQDFSKLTHGCDAGVEHSRILVGRPDNQLRRVNRAKCGDNLPHVVPFLLIRQKSAKAKSVQQGNTSSPAFPYKFACKLKTLMVDFFPEQADLVT